MSQSSEPRPVAGMVGALAVVVLLVLGWVGFRALTSDHPATPVKTVEWKTWLASGRADRALVMYAPDELPAGWRATSARYTSGIAPRWHLGLLTDQGRYVGLEESHAGTRQLVQQYVDDHAVQGEDVVIDGVTWQTWTDSGGDYAVVRTVPGLDGTPSERLIVVGSAPDAEIRAFAGSLVPSAVEG